VKKFIGILAAFALVFTLESDSSAQQNRATGATRASPANAKRASTPARAGANRASPANAKRAGAARRNRPTGGGGGGGGTGSDTSGVNDIPINCLKAYSDCMDEFAAAAVSKFDAFRNDPSVRQLQRTGDPFRCIFNSSVARTGFFPALNNECEDSALTPSAQLLCRQFNGIVAVGGTTDASGTTTGATQRNVLGALFNNTTGTNNIVNQATAVAGACPFNMAAQLNADRINFGRSQPELRNPIQGTGADSRHSCTCTIVRVSTGGIVAPDTDTSHANNRGNRFACQPGSERLMMGVRAGTREFRNKDANYLYLGYNYFCGITENVDEYGITMNDCIIAQNALASRAPFATKASTQYFLEAAFRMENGESRDGIPFRILNFQDSALYRNKISRMGLDTLEKYLVRNEDVNDLRRELGITPDEMDQFFSVSVPVPSNFVRVNGAGLLNEGTRLCLSGSRLSPTDQAKFGDANSQKLQQALRVLQRCTKPSNNDTQTAPGLAHDNNIALQSQQGEHDNPITLAYQMFYLAGIEPHVGQGARTSANNDGRNAANSVVGDFHSVVRSCQAYESNLAAARGAAYARMVDFFNNFLEENLAKLIRGSTRNVRTIATEFAGLRTLDSELQQVEAAATTANLEMRNQLRTQMATAHATAILRECTKMLRTWEIDVGNMYTLFNDLNVIVRIDNSTVHPQWIHETTEISQLDDATTSIPDNGAQTIALGFRPISKTMMFENNKIPAVSPRRWTPAVEGDLLGYAEIPNAANRNVMEHYYVLRSADETNHLVKIDRVDAERRVLRFSDVVNSSGFVDVACKDVAGFTYDALDLTKVKAWSTCPIFELIGATASGFLPEGIYRVGIVGSGGGAAGHRGKNHATAGMGGSGELIVRLLTLTGRTDFTLNIGDGGGAGGDKAQAGKDGSSTVFTLSTQGRVSTAMINWLRTKVPTTGITSMGGMGGQPTRAGDALTTGVRGRHGNEASIINWDNESDRNTKMWGTPMFNMGAGGRPVSGEAINSIDNPTDELMRGRRGQPGGLLVQCPSTSTSSNSANFIPENPISMGGEIDCKAVAELHKFELDWLKSDYKNTCGSHKNYVKGGNNGKKKAWANSLSKIKFYAQVNNAFCADQGTLPVQQLAVSSEKWKDVSSWFKGWAGFGWTTGVAAGGYLATLAIIGFTNAWNPMGWVALGGAAIAAATMWIVGNSVYYCVHAGLSWDNDGNWNGTILDPVPNQ